MALQWHSQLERVVVVREQRLGSMRQQAKRGQRHIIAKLKRLERDHRLQKRRVREHWDRDEQLRH